MIGGYEVVSLILPHYCTVGKSKNIKKEAKNNSKSNCKGVICKPKGRRENNWKSVKKIEAKGMVYDRRNFPMQGFIYLSKFSYRHVQGIWFKLDQISNKILFNQ